MFDKKSNKPDPKADKPLDRKARKQGKLFSKGVRRFLRYNDDLLSDEDREVIVGKKEDFDASLTSDKKRKELEAMAEDLNKTCQKAVPSYRPNALKENIEVLFVAVLIAMGIRAYFIQQFKIPTGSMQPTLNGVIAYPSHDVQVKEMGLSERSAPEDYEYPSLPKRLFDKLWYGRSHVKWVAKSDQTIVIGRTSPRKAYGSPNFFGKNYLIFFNRTKLILPDGTTYSAPGPLSRVPELLNQRLQSAGNGVIMLSFKKGDTIAEGFLDTGDQLVVNKFIYHWITPKRGEVFVFNTRGIPGIQGGLNPPEQGSQHYIKRICGIPGDDLKINESDLIINGKAPTEEGILKVISQEGYYNGY
ncbi:MAG: S26 family signal peptidase, partial [Verrucomicrobiota bacterium]